MTTILAKKPILRTILLLLALALVITLAIIFRPKPPLYALADLALADSPNKDTLATTIISASTPDQKADVIYSTGSTLEQALEKTITKITASDNYSNYIYFRLDIAYGPAAANPAKLSATLPNIGDHTYFSSTDTPRAVKLSSTPQTIEGKQLEDLIHKNALFLAHQLDAEGRFTYGFNILTLEEPDTYFTEAHAATISALLKVYGLTKNAYLLEQARLAIDYLTQFIVTSEDMTDHAFVTDASSNSIDLSATALTAIALADHQDITGSTEHASLLRYLINGIEYMHVGTDCTFYNHELDLDFSPIASDTPHYYDAQATYATVRAATTLADDELLPRVVRNLDRMVAKEVYATEAPKWLALSIKAYEQSAAADPTKAYTAPTLATPSVADIYTNFTEPWIAMYSANPSRALHSFHDADFSTSLPTNQSALTNLLELYKVF